MRVCCLVVTFNRKELLQRCITKCLAQSANPDILIWDNQSTDGTREALEEAGLLSSDRVIYCLSDKNGGGSYGFSNGLRKCIELGYDYVWLLDDDGYPETDDCLEVCLNNCPSGKSAIVNALVHDGEYLTFPMAGCTTVEEFNRKASGEHYVKGAAAPFNGTLVSSDVVKKIGYPISYFFVSGDEAEYVLRAQSQGVELATVPSALYYHPRNSGSRVKIPLTKTYVFQAAAWRIYCRSRNYTYIYRHYRKNQTVVLWAKELIKCLFQKDKKIEKIAAAVDGFRDGCRERFELDEIFKRM